MIALSRAPRYFDDPAHCSWQWHYVKGRNGGNLLLFTEQWQRLRLPPDGQSDDPLRVDLLDQTDGKVYATQMYVSYEHVGSREEARDEDWNAVPAASLQSYFYACHHCPCHRKSAAEAAGAVVEDAECEGNRFLIQAITAFTLPELILYSETYSCEELEARLCC